MKIFAEVDVYNRSTGAKEVDFKAVSLVCDFCGNPIESDGYSHGIHQQVSFEIKEVGGSEESYYYHQENSPEDIDIPDTVDWYKVFSEHPHYDYCCDEGGISCSRLLFEIPFEQRMDESWGMKVPKNLETVMQESRLRVVAKLLSEGRSPKELGIEKD